MGTHVVKCKKAAVLSTHQHGNAMTLRRYKVAVFSKHRRGRNQLPRYATQQFGIALEPRIAAVAVRVEQCRKGSIGTKHPGSIIEAPSHVPCPRTATRKGERGIFARGTETTPFPFFNYPFPLFDQVMRRVTVRWISRYTVTATIAVKNVPVHNIAGPR